MPQLNPEYFVSQLFWLVISFTFLFIFLWRISLPRIDSVLKKRSNKINDDINSAKQFQTEAEEVQNNIDKKLLKAKSETVDLIKNTTFNLQNQTIEELEKLDQNLNKKIDEASAKINENKKKSFKEINDQIFEITKLTISKISNLQINEDEIKDFVNKAQKKDI